MRQCLFCKIINKEVSSDIVYEDDKVVVFKDINPKGPVHFLIVPKKHLESIKSEGSEKVAAELILTAKKIAKERKIEGYKLVFNVGKKGGQMIEHLHLHLLGGKTLSWSKY